VVFDLGTMQEILQNFLHFGANTSVCEGSQLNTWKRVLSLVSGIHARFSANFLA
jgi:hypothetical protein